MMWSRYATAPGLLTESALAPLEDEVVCAEDLEDHLYVSCK